MTSQFAPVSDKPLSKLSAAVMTISDRCSQGLTRDESGPLLATELSARGAEVTSITIVPDERSAIQAGVLEAVAKKVHFVFTTGGTGLSPRDVTPEALEEIFEKTIVGFGERLRAEGARFNSLAYLSRSLAGVIGQTIVVALPGSPKAVSEGVMILQDLLPHAIHIVRGGKHG